MVPLLVGTATASTISANACLCGVIISNENFINSKHEALFDFIYAADHIKGLFTLGVICTFKNIFESFDGLFKPHIFTRLCGKCFSYEHWLGEKTVYFTRTGYDQFVFIA